MVPLALIIAVMVFESSGIGAAQMQDVGEDFGKVWLEQYGNKFPSADANKSQDLWSWGGQPRGYGIFKGELYPMLAAPEYYYPLIDGNATPIIINGTAANPVNYMTSEFMTDPWFLAQITGQPVIVVHPGTDRGSTLL
jgi:hypothetical protein